MVSVPRILTSQVAPGGIPSPRLPIGAPASAYGAGLAGDVQDIAFKEMHDRDRSTAMEAVRQARKAVDGLWWGEGGGKAKEGQAFFDWSAGAGKQLERQLSSLTSGLSPAQQELAQDHLDDLRDDFDRNIRAKGVEARRTYLELERESELQSQADSAVLAASDGDADRLGRALERGAAVVDAFATEHGEYLPGPEVDWRKERTQAFESGVVARGIEGALRLGNTGLAKSYFERFGDKLVGDQKASVAASVADAWSLTEVSTAYDAIAAENPIQLGADAKAAAEAAGRPWRSPSAQLVHRKAEIRRLGKEQGWSAKQIDDAVDYAHGRTAEEIQAAEAKLNDVFQALSNELAQPGNDLLTLQRTRPTAYRNISPEMQTALHKQAALQAGADMKAEQDKTYHGLLSMASAAATSTEARDEFMRPGGALDREMAILTPQQRGELSRIRDAMVKNQNDVLGGLLSPTERVTAHIKAINENGKDLDDEEELAYRVAFESAMTEWRSYPQNAGKEMPAEEQEKLLDRLMLTEVFDVQGGAVVLEEPAYQTDPDELPPLRPSWITTRGAPAILRKQAAAGLPLRAPTEEELKRLYLNELVLYGTGKNPGIALPEDIAAAQEKFRDDFRSSQPGVPAPSLRAAKAPVTMADRYRMARFGR